MVWTPAKLSTAKAMYASGDYDVSSIVKFHARVCFVCCYVRACGRRVAAFGGGWSGGLLSV